MTYDEILYSVVSGVATVTLNRPDRLNAWTSRMEEQVLDAMRAAAADGSVRVIVLTGAGRGFCAGADMSMLTGAAQGTGAQRSFVQTEAGIGEGGRADFRRKHSWLISIEKPVICAINGPVVGLGFIVALYCDIRLASDAARFSTVFAKRGLIAEYGIAWILPRLVGMANTIELLFSARTFDAAEALRLGLVQRVFPQEGFAEAAQAYANDLANTVSPRSLRVMKRQIYEAQFQTLGEALDTATEEMKASFESDDFREGVAHYVEKRAAQFTGK
ncbi:MAG: enoyl-CoA hydratase [Bryobacteraceae bacterium]